MLIIRLSTLGPTGYQQALPLAERLQAIKRLSWSKKRASWRHRPWRDSLVVEENRLVLDLLSIAIQQAEWTVLLQDGDQEVTAFNDLVATVQRVYPQTTPILIELGAILLPEERVPVTLAQYRDILETIDLEHMIREQTEFGRALGIPVYLEANAKYMSILQRASTRRLSLLNLLEGEV